MKRKLVKQGAATMMVSLPAKWIKHHKLGKGSEIDIELLNQDLILSAGLVETKTETRIKLTGLTESLIRTLITNTYRRGFDRVAIEFQTEKQFQVMNDVIKSRLVGFEVIKKEKNYCVVENITEPSSEQFDTLLNKIFYNISELFDATMRRMKGEKADFEDVEERIQKYDNFCRRVISKRKISSNSEFLWAFLVLLIHAQREIYLMNKLRIEDVSKNVVDLLNKCQGIFEMIKRAYFEKNPSILADVHSKEKELIYKKGYKLIDNSKEARIIYHILSAIRQFYQANSPLAGILTENMHS